MTDAKSTKDMLRAFRDQHEDVALEMTNATSKRAASCITATRLVNLVLWALVLNLQVVHSPV